MAEARALTVDEGLQCPIKNGILLDDGTPASDVCKKNQGIKDILEGLKYSSPEDKRAGLNVLSAACVELDDMVGCLPK